MLPKMKRGQITKKAHISVIWNLIEDSREKKISLRKAAMMKGCGDAIACEWQRKLQAMYFNLSKKSFADASHVTIITDASTHGTKNLQVSIAYSTKEGPRCILHISSAFSWQKGRPE